ncbi:MAG: DUF4292 domain-containing protein [Flavobacteriales bacterium]|nr:DUF4292 domain-containing protein [Flavobacteriales bacterium]
MKRNLLNNLFLSVVFVVGTLGCSVLKPNPNNKDKIKTIGYKKLKNYINENQFNYEWLKLKGDANIVFKGDEEKIKTNFRLRNDSIIWMNFSKASIQLLTGLVGKDSLKAVIKYPEKKYFSGTFNELQKMIAVNLSFKLIEDLLTGRMIGYEKSKKTNVQIKENKYYLKYDIKDNGTNENNYSVQYWINPKLFKCDSIVVSSAANENIMVVSYNHWSQIENQYFPMKVNFNFTNLSDTIALELKYKSPLKINAQQNFPFKVSEKYIPIVIE